MKKGQLWLEDGWPQLHLNDLVTSFGMNIWYVDRYVRKLIVLFCLVGFSLRPSWADVVPYNGSEVAPNIALIQVTHDGVSVDLEIFVDDLPIFSDLLPEEWLSGDMSNGQNSVDRLKRFESQGLSIIPGDGAPLSVEIRLIEPRMRKDRSSPLAGQRNPLTGQVVPSPPDDPRVLFVELFYPFRGQKPGTLTIRPPMDGDAPATTIGMQVFDRGVPVTDFKFLSAAADLSIHWPDPWYSRFSATNLNRRAKDGTSTFLYVEPREVRSETLIRLQELAPWINETFDEGQILDPDRAAQLANTAAHVLADRNPVTIDGVTVKPQRSTAELLQLTARGFQIVEPGREVPVNNAFVGVILSFASPDLPDHVTVNWDMFDENISRVATISNDMAGPLLGEVTPEDPQFPWRNHLLKYERPSVTPIPVKGLPNLSRNLAWLSGYVCFAALLIVLFRKERGQKIVGLGVGMFALFTSVSLSGYLPGLPWSANSLPEPVVAESVFGSTVANLNSAALETTPEGRKTELAVVVTNSSLNAVAAELERGLAIRVPGGSLARVTDVSDLNLEQISATSKRGGFSALANWSVRAEAGHWGHSHKRSITFRALVELVPENGHWKLDGMTILEARDSDA